MGSSQRPAAPITSGDVVRAYQVTKTSSDGAITAGPVLIDAARVVDVSSTSSSSDSQTVSLLVQSTAAQVLVNAAGQGTVALGVLPRSTKPTIDFRTS